MWRLKIEKERKMRRELKFGGGTIAPHDSNRSNQMLLKGDMGIKGVFE
jgi:hypothetical protein